MTAVRWAAAAVTVLMGLMNVGLLVGGEPQGIPMALVWGFVALGVVGIAAAVGLVVRTAWARSVVVAVGAVNAVSSVVAAVLNVEGALIGLVIGGLGAALGYATRPPTASGARSA